MAKLEKIKLTDAERVKQALRRLTQRAIRELKEDTGETDFTDNESAFHFPDRVISSELGATLDSTRAVIAKSKDIPSELIGEKALIAWSPDLTERLERAAAKNA